MHFSLVTEVSLKEVRKIRGHVKSEIPSIDGVKDNGQIADKFAKQYKELFNSNPSNPEDFKHSNSVSDCCVTLKHIKDAIKRLKCEKQDGVYNNMASEHFVNA